MYFTSSNRRDVPVTVQTIFRMGLSGCFCTNLGGTAGILFLSLVNQGTGFFILGDFYEDII